MDRNRKKREKALEKELLLVQKQETKLERAVLRAKSAAWKTGLESKIPEKVYAGLESAFCKGFALIFGRGRKFIEKSYNKERIQADHAIQNFAAQKKGGRKELKQVRKAASRSNLLNLTATTAEGIGLGVLGIGLPDIVLFVGTLLKGVYETALRYGFDYESPQEEFLILKMMEAAMSDAGNWRDRNQQVDTLMESSDYPVTQEELDAQIKSTASAFAVDMLLLKFIQGIPIVGVIGGAANPAYYRKVMNYVQLKYRKRYLNGLLQK